MCGLEKKTVLFVLLHCPEEMILHVIEVDRIHKEHLSMLFITFSSSSSCSCTCSSSCPFVASFAIYWWSNVMEMLSSVYLIISYHFMIGQTSPLLTQNEKMLVWRSKNAQLSGVLRAFEQSSIHLSFARDQFSLFYVRVSSTHKHMHMHMHAIILVRTHASQKRNK